MAVAWATQGCEETKLDERKEHRDWVPTLEQRIEGRLLLTEDGGEAARNMLSKERPQLPEEEEEPEICPR